MTSHLKIVIGAAIFIYALTTHSEAQCTTCDGDVKVDFKGAMCIKGDFTLQLHDKTVAPLAPGASCSDYTESAPLPDKVKLKPNKSYTMTLTATPSGSDGGLSSIHLEVSAPACYKVYIDDEETSVYDGEGPGCGQGQSLTKTFDVVIKPNSSGGAGSGGDGTVSGGSSSGGLSAEFSLGGTANGSAGSISLSSGTISPDLKASSITAVTINGTAATRLDEYFYKEITTTTTGEIHIPYTVAASDGNGTTSRDGGKFLPSTPETFIHDFDGNLTSDGRFTYTWDAENRLTTMETHSTIPLPARRKLVFAYDFMGRRIKKDVWHGTSSGGWQLHHKFDFIHQLSGWNILAERSGGSKDTLLRTYTWGTDLSGTLNGAGGVGGLLFTTLHTSGKTFANAMDLNGNVTLLVNTATGQSAATYDYGPFGELLRQSGEYAMLNPFRFSTKYADDETGLLDYGNRYYDPITGRWRSKDPMFEIIGEMPEFLPEGANLYSFVGNNPINWFDYLGLAASSFKLAFKGAGGIDPNGQWAAFTTNVFGSTDLSGGIKAAIKHFDNNNDNKLNASDCPPFRIRVVGYSWGGWTAIKFAQKMGEKVTDPNTSLKIAVGTLDPVDTLRSGNAKLPAWAKSGTNIYQANGCYRGCPGAGGWYKGKSVSGATNTDLTSTPHGQLGYKPNQQNYDHITIQVKAADVVSAVNSANLN